MRMREWTLVELHEGYNPRIRIDGYKKPFGRILTINKEKNKRMKMLSKKGTVQISSLQQNHSLSPYFPPA